MAGRVFFEKKNSLVCHAGDDDDACTGRMLCTAGNLKRGDMGKDGCCSRCPAAQSAARRDHYGLPQPRDKSPVVCAAEPSRSCRDVGIHPVRADLSGRSVLQR